jgi:hypothetical protein
VSILTDVDDATLLAGMLFAAEAWVSKPRKKYVYDADPIIVKEGLLAWQREHMEEAHGRDPDLE